MVERYHHGGLAEALIEAALALIKEGSGTPSLREVARRAGVSAMAPYRHFEDRAALIGAVTSRGFEKLGAVLTEADAGPTPVEALVAQGHAYIAFALSHPMLFRLMFAGGPAAAPTPEDYGYDVLAHRAAEIAPGAGEAAALACRSLVHGLATLTIDQRLGSLTPAAIDAALRLLVDGIVAQQHAGSNGNRTS